MKTSTTSSLALLLAWSSNSLAIFTVNILKPRNSRHLNLKSLSSRATITESLANNITAGSYYAIVEVGTPGQQQTLAIDTGSSDVWVLSNVADVCINVTLQAEGEDGCISTFDPSKSSTFKDLAPGQFDIEYEGGTGSMGDYIADTLTIGGSVIRSQEMGLALNATQFTGLLGIGYESNEASNSASDEQHPFIYSSLVDSMVSQGLIGSKAYSLYLNDLDASTGAIIFGGIDSDKFHGSLFQLPVVPSTSENGTSTFTSFTVAMTSFSITGQVDNTTSFTESNFQELVVLDSGTTLTYVSSDLAELIYRQLGAIDDTQNSGFVLVDCEILDYAPLTTFNFGFGGPSGKVIEVPIDEMILSLDGFFTPSNDGVVSPFPSTCALGLIGQEQDGEGDEVPYILGDTFLRSAYVVYDLANNVVAMAQTIFNSTTSNITDIGPNNDAIPDVVGVPVTGLPPAATGTLSGGRSTTTGRPASTSTQSGAKGSANSIVARGGDPTLRTVFIIAITTSFIGGVLFMV